MHFFSEWNVSRSPIVTHVVDGHYGKLSFKYYRGKDSLESF